MKYKIVVIVSFLPSNGEIYDANLGAKAGVPPCSTLVLAVE